MVSCLKNQNIYQWPPVRDAMPVACTEQETGLALFQDPFHLCLIVESFVEYSPLYQLHETKPSGVMCIY